MQYDAYFESLCHCYGGPIINISIFLIRYYYGKLTLFIHILIGLFAAIFTIYTSIGIITTADRDSTPVQMYQQNQNVDLRSHYVIGVVSLFLILFLVIIGLITRIANVCQARSVVILRLKRTHKIVGYIILILCKANIYVIAFNKSYGIFIQDIVCIVIFILWKLLMPRMGSKITPQINQNTEMKRIASINQLPSESDYCVFANYVYDLSPLYFFHPAGFQVIKSIKSKEVDRYIYGMYASEELPEVAKHSHFARSFSLLNQPCAKVSIPSPFDGFNADQVPVQICQLDVVSAEGSIYLMMLKGVYNQFIFKGYQCWQQLGRYYSITLNNKFTRLYTSVNFLVLKNQKLMEKILKITNNSKNLKKMSKTEHQLAQIKHNTSTLNIQHNESIIPILFKMYPNSRFTQPLVSQYLNKNPQLILSCPKGQGLQFAQLKAGKIILVAGGTGLYPFSDLIDLLFKEQIIKHQPELKAQLLQISPILKTKSFKEFSFHLMGAFNQLNDIHPITLSQLVFLSKHHPNFTLTLKTKQKSNKELAEGKIYFHNGGFDTLLQKELEQINSVSKIYICGPPRMNEQLSLFLRENYKLADLYSIL